MENSHILLFAIFLPFLTGAWVNLTGKNSILRNISMLTLSGCSFALVILLAKKLFAGNIISLEFFKFLPGIGIDFKIEPLGLIYAGLATGLWVVTILYSIGYFNYLKDRKQTKFFIYLSLSIGCSVGLAFADNLLTMLIFYEGLTFATYPLVAHKGDAKSVAGANKYLYYLLGTSIFLFLPAIIATMAIAGNGQFSNSGVFSHGIDEVTKIFLLLLFAYGIGKAALVPVHGWLPAAMAAPAPVSALLHAVAVVKAGVFCVMKIIVYIFGVENLAEKSSNLITTDILSYIAAVSALTASLLAVMEKNLKRRLAYSTVAQLSYIILAASIFSFEGIEAGAIHMLSHGLAKITLFFAIGAVIILTGKEVLQDIYGFGRSMPFIFICFTLASFSMIGLPFLAGDISKEMIMAAAQKANKIWIIYVLYIGSILSAIYLLQVSWVAFFKKPDLAGKIKVPGLIMLSLAITTGLTLSFSLYDFWILKLAERI